MSDQQLLERIAKGDRDAFLAFYDLHAGRVLGLLVRSLRNRDDAEDVLQETFYQVWKSAQQYDARRATPDVWLFLLARSRALDFLRRRRRAAAASPLPISGTTGDPAQMMAQSEASEAVRQAMARLPEEQRNAICLAFYGGWTHEQVAQHQAIPLGTAKTRIWLGIKRLRSLLGAGQKVPLT